MPFHQFEDSWNESASEAITRINRENEEEENSFFDDVEEYVSETIDQIEEWFTED